MGDGLTHFLIISASGSSEPDVEAFADADEAVRRYEKAEREHEGDAGVQIVLVSSDSLDTVQKTHANFWGRDEDPASGLEHLE